MLHLRQIVSVLSVFYFVNLVNAKVADEIFGDVFDILKSDKEALQMRLELMEHNMQAQKKSLIEIDHKLEALQDNINRQFTSLEKKFERLLEIVPEVVSEGILLEDEPKLCIGKPNLGILCSDHSLPKMCSDSISQNCLDNKCRVKNSIYGPKSFWVSCDREWTVIQRRINGSVNFYRTWKEYQQGFGDLDGEFWIGLDKLHSLTTIMGPVELLIKLRDFDNVERYAKYDSFSVGNETRNYMLTTLGDYSGDAGDSLSWNKENRFSTHDKDNDSYRGKNCAEMLQGAWWHTSCTHSNLNGVYYDLGVVPKDKFMSGIYWYQFHTFKGLKFVEMMIRPKKN